MLITKNKKIYIYFFCIFTLFISFVLGENSSGGSKLDYHITKQFTDAFSINFIYGIDYFIKSGQVQSPFFYILISFLEKLLSIDYLKYTYIIISSSIPLIFYISLKKKFQNVNRNYLFFLSLIIFFSPYFRSSSVWITTDNLGVLFFILSVSKYLSLEKKRTLSNLLLCVTYLTVAIYIRQYYCIFLIFYSFKFFQFFDLKKIFFIIIYLLLIFIPILVYYYYFLDNNVSKSLNSEINNTVFQLNPVNNLIIFMSLYFFYISPFYINKLNVIYEYFKKHIVKHLIFILIFSIIFFTSSNTYGGYGGGIFMKISSISNYYQIFFLSSLLGTLLLFSNINLNNILVYLCLIFAFPTIIIYQKYYDPLLILTLLTLTEKDLLNGFIANEIVSLKFLYSYFFLFLISSNLYYLI